VDLTALGARLRGVALPRPLLVAVPGSTGLRWTVEAHLRELGWVTAATGPAEADLLVVCGDPGPELAAAVDVVWDQLPTPRARVAITTANGVGDQLWAARAQIADVAHQRRDLAARGPGPQDQEMAPGGLDMAGQGEDRDGLRLEQLHPVWGPVLADWPAGLRLELTLQGDVVQEVGVHVLDADVANDVADDVANDVADDVADEALEPRAVAADELGRVLAVLGWPAAADRARWLREELAAGGDGGPRLHALAARVRRSRGVRAATVGVAVHRGADAADRVAGLLGAMTGTPYDRDREAALQALPELLTGLEVGAARLVVASLPLTPIAAGVVTRG
jgi:hypothetical protein